MKYIFIAGAPGSKWSSVSKNIYFSNSIDRSDATPEREYYHDAPGTLELMHMGAYFDPGMEFGDWFDHLNEHTKEECEAEMYSMYMDVIREEKEWAEYLFQKGPVIGLNAQILKDFVDYTAAEALKVIGIKYQQAAPKSTPIPWFNKHVHTDKKQTALQENESTNYVIGVMGDTLNYDELPEL